MTTEATTWDRAALPGLAPPPRATIEDVRVTFEDLFTAEYPRVVAIANRVLSDLAEAEEIAQEVFVAYHRGHAADAPYAAPWLHAAASHAALNRLRSNRRRAQREERTARADADHAEDPAAMVVAAEQATVVREALRRLPTRMSAVLALRYSGLSYAEVASAMGVGIGNVGTLLRRAEARLRLEVEK